ncbi:unnamed protein product [Ceratitis capitata]|uniref:(Mediterranean fruit fly) hypothetical protein n=1 Tax=Ceratitis capitata TaxID=7213 RepID=A0A811UES1_CERCA|nr:unnamed protein product [Ceratitis capitata]
MQIHQKRLKHSYDFCCCWEFALSRSHLHSKVETLGSNLVELDKYSWELNELGSRHIKKKSYSS